MKKKNHKSYIVTEHSVQSYQAELSEHEWIHFPYEHEDAFFSAVSRGDREAAFLAMEKVTGISVTDPEIAAQQLADASPTNAGVMSRKEQKQAEYAAVLAVSLLARAAIRGGLDPYLAYNLNDLYLQRISEAEDGSRLWLLVFEALDVFLDEMKKLASVQMRSIHTLHAKQYIGMNLNKPLTLEEIASAIGLSPSYLSTVFKQTEGVGLKEYVISQRIEAAKNLLMYSAADIGVIAAYVGFCSQSHFGKMFRTRTGMTPLTFRNVMQR